MTEQFYKLASLWKRDSQAAYDELNKMSISELKLFARSNDIQYGGKQNKKEIIKLICVKFTRRFRV